MFILHHTGPNQKLLIERFNRGNSIIPQRPEPHCKASELSNEMTCLCRMANNLWSSVTSQSWKSLLNLKKSLLSVLLICWIVKSLWHDIQNKLWNSIFSKLSPHKRMFPQIDSLSISYLEWDIYFKIFPSLQYVSPQSASKRHSASLVLDPSVIDPYLSAISPLQRFQYHILYWS